MSIITWDETGYSKSVMRLGLRIYMGLILCFGCLSVQWHFVCFLRDFIN